MNSFVIRTMNNFLINFIVDISMLVKLRSTMDESIERIKSMGSNDKQFEKKKSEMDAAMKKSIRMVVVNTSIGLLLKLPLVFLPLINTIAKFYYNNSRSYNSGFGSESRYKKHAFDYFYTQLFNTDF